MISIIVPIYNAELYLSECLDSICSQTYHDLEILLIDDGSTDSSLKICREYAARDKRIQVFQKANGGPSDTRNYGMDRAGGEYIMFFDSDDYAKPDLCEKLVSAMESDATDFVLCGNFNVAASRVTQRLPFQQAQTFFGDDYYRQITVATLGLTGALLHHPEKNDRLTPVWARLYRREIIAANHIRYIDLNKVPSECLLFNFEYCLHARSASYVHEALYYYRRDTVHSETKSYRKRLWDKWCYWSDYMQALLASNGSPQELTAAYNSRLCCSVITLGGNAMRLPTLRERLNEMRGYLNSEVLKKAFAGFDYSNCPVHWRLFFFSAKKRYIHLYYFMRWSMTKILNYRKK